MKKRPSANRPLMACIAGVVAGLFAGLVGLVPTIAGADTPENAPQACSSALQGNSDADLVMTTDPVGGTEVFPGDSIEVTLTWGDTVWNDISKIVICSTVDGVLDEGTIYHEAPGVDDGEASTTFTVPADAEEICVHGRISGNPGPGNTSDDTHKTGQTCFPITADACPDLPGNQTEGDDCTPDECPDLPGEQVPGDDCTPDECPELPGEQVPGDDCTPDECPELPGEQVPGDDCTPDACPDMDGDQEPGTDCTPDACPDMEGDQEPGTDCDPEVDACPDVEGMQAEGTDCDEDVDPNVIEKDDPSTPAPTEVKGSQTLPRTGAETAPMVNAALGLLAVGGVLVASTRRKARGVTR